MTEIKNRQFDEERALYGQTDLAVAHCRFDGPADGESAFKECQTIRVTDSYFNLRYPFWHDAGVVLEDCELTTLCRAALWYSSAIEATDCCLHGIKALRECHGVTLRDCDILSTEFGWNTTDLVAEDCKLQGEYAFFQGKNLRFRGLQMSGKYSFQYIENAIFENCRLDTKDAFWHARHVTVKNCTVKGEYLGWYCEDVTFENCRIIGTQPLCYCKGLRLIDCEMIDTDLCFEKSEVEATLTAPVVSIKNPAAGQITLPACGELIMDDPNAHGAITLTY